MNLSILLQNLYYLYLICLKFPSYQNAFVFPQKKSNFDKKGFISKMMDGVSTKM